MSARTRGRAATASAFDSRTGGLLWETMLPYSANATPITYQAEGRQFVVIAAGGGRSLGK
jgi:quinoprotein glucose dehydrogenase